MKKGVGMVLAEKVMKKVRKCAMMFSQLHAQWFLQCQGECGLIEGHAYSFFYMWLSMGPSG